MRADLLADASCPEIGTTQSFQNLFQFHDVLTLSTAFSTLVLTKRRAKSCIKLEIQIDPQKTLILFELFTKGGESKIVDASARQVNICMILALLKQMGIIFTE